jgi:hypothetical protein
MNSKFMVFGLVLILCLSVSSSVFGQTYSTLNGLAVSGQTGNYIQSVLKIIPSHNGQSFLIYAQTNSGVDWFLGEKNSAGIQLFAIPNIMRKISGEVVAVTNKNFKAVSSSSGQLSNNSSAIGDVTVDASASTFGAIFVKGYPELFETEYILGNDDYSPYKTSVNDISEYADPTYQKSVVGQALYKDRCADGSNNQLVRKSAVIWGIGGGANFSTDYYHPYNPPSSICGLQKRWDASALGVNAEGNRILIGLGEPTSNTFNVSESYTRLALFGYLPPGGESGILYPIFNRSLQELGLSELHEITMAQIIEDFKIVLHAKQRIDGTYTQLFIDSLGVVPLPQTASGCKLGKLSKIAGRTLIGQSCGGVARFLIFNSESRAFTPIGANRVFPNILDALFSAVAEGFTQGLALSPTGLAKVKH